MEKIVSGLLKYKPYEQIDCFKNMLSFLSVLKYSIDFYRLYLSLLKHPFIYSLIFRYKTQ